MKGNMVKGTRPEAIDIQSAYIQAGVPLTEFVRADTAIKYGNCRGKTYREVAESSGSVETDLITKLQDTLRRNATDKLPEY